MLPVDARCRYMTREEPLGTWNESLELLTMTEHETQITYHAFLRRAIPALPSSSCHLGWRLVTAR